MLKGQPFRYWQKKENAFILHAKNYNIISKKILNEIESQEMNLQELVKEEESENSDSKVKEEEIKEDDFCQFIRKYYIPAPKFSYNWIKAFLKRNKMSWRKAHFARRNKIDPTYVKLYTKKWQEQ